MLADGKIDSLDTHLEQFKLNDQSRHNDLQVLLKEYAQLLDDYKVLKKAYEDKSTAVLPRSTAVLPTAFVKQPQNPYVLVLVDGNGYIFNDELIREREEGGMRAARMLNDVVEKYIQQSIPEARNSRVIVRIYADLTNLSKKLAKSKVTGLEKRSIAPFSAAFTRAISLFDYIDALDEEGTKFKIREQFKLASEDSSCSQILYAACHDTAYLSQLVPFSGIRDKITLVQGAGWNSEFHQFNLNVTQFPTIFRWSELPTSVLNPKVSAPNGSAAPKTKAAQKAAAPPTSFALRQDSWRRNEATSVTDSTFGTDEQSPVEINGYGDHGGIGFDTHDGIVWSKKPSPSQKGPQQPCKYFQKGFCRFGHKCSFQHIPTDSNGSSPSTTSPGANHPRTNLAAILPSTVLPGLIPVNASHQRLDIVIPFPSPEAWRIYNARFHIQKPCNSYHLQRVCTSFNCPYDHTELEPETRHVLEFVVKCNPCPKKGACRQVDCSYGHICQKEGCRGQIKGCRMKADLHNVDPVMVSLVRAEETAVHGQGEGRADLEGLEMPDVNTYHW